MPNSLRAKLSKLRYKGEITQEEYTELIKKLDGHDSALLDKVADRINSLKYDTCDSVTRRIEHQLKAEEDE